MRRIWEVRTSDIFFKEVWLNILTDVSYKCSVLSDKIYDKLIKNITGFYFLTVKSKFYVLFQNMLDSTTLLIGVNMACLD